MKEELKTGYPHKDKMWLKYYDSEFFKRENQCTGIYDYMKEKTKNIQDYTALSYFGKKVLYGELYEIKKINLSYHPCKLNNPRSLLLRQNNILGFQNN